MDTQSCVKDIPAAEPGSRWRAATAEDIDKEVQVRHWSGQAWRYVAGIAAANLLTFDMTKCQVLPPMRSCDPYGKLSDGTLLVAGQVYSARFNGVPDAEGNVCYEPDAEFKPYKAVRNGCLFSLWPVTGSSGYRLPHYCDFE